MSDALRDRIAEVLFEHYSRSDGLDVTAEESAQAVIDDLGLVEERTVRVVDYGAGPLRIPESRVVGKWER